MNRKKEIEMKRNKRKACSSLKRTRNGRKNKQFRWRGHYEASEEWNETESKHKHRHRRFPYIPTHWSGRAQQSDCEHVQCAWLNSVRRLKRGPFDTPHTRLAHMCALFTFESFGLRRSAGVVSFFALKIHSHSSSCVPSLHRNSSTRKNEYDGNTNLSHRIIPMHAPHILFVRFHVFFFCCALVRCQMQKTCKIFTSFKTQTTHKWHHSRVWLQTKSDRKTKNRICRQLRLAASFVWRCTRIQAAERIKKLARYLRHWTEHMQNEKINFFTQTLRSEWKTIRANANFYCLRSQYLHLLLHGPGRDVCSSLPSPNVFGTDNNGSLINSNGSPFTVLLPPTQTVDVVIHEIYNHSAMHSPTAIYIYTNLALLHKRIHVSLVQTIKWKNFVPNERKYSPLVKRKQKREKQINKE